jgi:hypothetical protein
MSQMDANDFSLFRNLSSLFGRKVSLFRCAGNCVTGAKPRAALLGASN